MPHYTVFMLNAFLLTLVLIQALNMVAPRLGLLDAPRGRKIHEHPVPVTGGLAMFAAFVVPATQLPPPLRGYWELAAGAALLVAVGAVDDVLTLGPWEKLGGQIAAVLVMVLPGGHLIGMRTLLGAAGAGLPQMELVLTVGFVVAVVNAFNMFDGLDGLAGGAAAVALLWLAAAAAIVGMTVSLAHLLLLVCAVLGFLVFNLRHRWRRRATVYMGDAGSMMLGAAVAFFAIILSVVPARPAPLPALLWFFALPMFDMLIVVARRLAIGRSPLRGDRLHLHHFLLRAGIAQQTTAGILIAACFVLGAIGLIGWRLGLSDRLMLLGLIAPLSLHAYVVLHGWKFIGRRRGIPIPEAADLHPLQHAAE